MKKLLTLILAFMATTATLFASSGTCGENVTWDLTGGVLTISGSGPMEEYPKETDAPWYSERESIISVIIENGVTTVGRKAFMSYSTITSITLPESLTAIGDDAFRTASIESITIPANVASIGNLTFRWCSLLKTINVLPTTPPTLGTLPFSNIASDYVIYVPTAAFGAYKTADGWKDLNIQTEGGSSSSGTCGENVNWVLIGGVLTISGTGDMDDYSGKAAIPWYDERKSIVSVIIEDGVRSIGKHAFNECINIASVQIAQTITSIGNYAFRKCAALTSLTIPAAVKSIGKQAFLDCSGLTEITCEATTPPTCGDNVFDGVTNTIPVYVPKGYISAYQAADYWNEFTNIQAIPDGTFGPCGENVNWDLTDGVFTISGSGPMTDYKSSSNVPWRSVRESITSIVIENGVTSIGDYAFYYCRHLPSVTIPSSITSIGASALERCTGLKEITCEATTPPTCGADAFNYITNDIPVSVPAGTDNLYRAADGWKDFMNIKGVASGTCGANVNWDLTGDVLTISGTGYMTSYTSPSKRPWHSFASSITSVVIEEGVMNIGESAFEDFSSLTSVTIPNSLEVLEGYAFFGCSALSSVTIPDNIMTIGNSTFKYCSALTTITIPANVNYIKYQAFSGCTGLTEIICEATTPPTCEDLVFEGVTNTIPVYVPAESVSAYNAADSWNYFENIQAKGAGSKEIYAALSGSTMTIYYDDQKASHSDLLDKWSPEEGAYNVPDATRNLITKAVFDASMVDARPTRTYCWFYLMGGLTTIDGLANLNTSEVTDMTGMFQDCSSLTSLDISGFNTANVTSMYTMFYGCSSLTSLDVSGFNTAKVEYMNSMFEGCESLTSLDVSSFNTAKVENMGNMFGGCESLKTIYCDDEWNPSWSNGMFKYCTALVGGKGTKYDDSKTDKTYARPDGLDDQPGYFTAKGAGSNEIYATLSGSTMTIYFDDQKASHSDLLDKWTPESGVGMTSATRNLITKAVIDASMVDARPTGTKWWFWGLANLTTIDGLANLNTSEVTYMEAMFMQCTSLTSLDVSSFNTDKVTSMKYMFSGCSSLTTIYCDDEWNPSSSTDMFGGCTALVGGKGTKYDDSKKDATYARPDGLGGQPGYFTAKGAGSKEIYAALSGSTMTIYFDDQKASRPGALDKWTPEDGVDMDDATRETITKAVISPSMVDALPTRTAGWFFNLANLTTIDGLAYLNTSEVTNMAFMFNGCSSLISLDLSSFNTSSVVDMYGMFGSCSALTSLDVSGFNTAKVTDMSYMFNGCSSLTSLDLSGLNTSSVTGMDGMFGGCSSLTSLDVSNFNTAKVMSMNDMFYGCSALKTIYCNDAWNPSSSDNMFYDCTALVGGKGTKYDAGHVNAAYARPDGLDDQPGYFTAKGAGSKEIYAALSGSTMTIYFDDQKASRPGALTAWTPEEGAYNVPDATRQTITNAVINPSMVDARPTKTHCWFFYMDNLTTIDGLANLNTSEVTDMSSMFGICYSLTSLDVSSFNTVKVENMSAMFQGCSSLTSLDVSNFNTDNVKYMSNMFEGCSLLTSLDVSKFNTANVANMGYMFQGCESLKTIYSEDDWSASSVLEYSEDMFGGCTALVGGKGTKYDDSKKDATYARPDGLDDQPGYFTSPTYTGQALIDGINYFLDGSDLTAEVMPLGDGYYAGDIVLPEKVSYLKNDYAVTSVAGGAFSNCPELLTVTIPKSVNWIEPEAFFGSTKLTAVNVVAANADYSSLDGVLFNKVQSELIAYPTAKEGAYIVPEGVEIIMDVAFAENTHLTAVTLPASLYEIASLAFENCTGLEMITSRASAVPSLGSDVFVGVNKAIPVFVPKASIALYKAEFGWEDFTNYIAIEDKEAADAVIAKINAIGTVTYTPECKARIDAARGGYDALTAEQKGFVPSATYKILTDAEQTYADLKAKAEADQAAASAVIGKIDAIGTVTLESEAAILDARSAYDALTATQKLLVTNYSVLTAAEAKLEILKKQAESDEAAAKAVTDLINAIGTVTYTSESKARIDAAREAYDALTAAQKALVTNLTTLTAAEKAYADLKAQAEADQAAANIVIGKINAIGTVTYTPESKALIDAAREAYDALTDAQKGLVSSATYKILTDAEQTYADLKKKADADLAAASIVIGKINAIGTVTLSSEAAILDARSAYDALTDAQKVLVTNYATLTAAEKAYADLKAQAEADQAAANVVINQIDAIGEVTLASEPAIVAARSAYNALTAAQQALVTNYSVLTAAEAKLEILKKQAESDEAAAHAVTDLIDAIGTVTLESEAAITAARSAYDALTAAQKLLVTNLSTLTAAEKKLAELKANAEAVANAKLQLKNIVSQANELKMVAMLYAPTAVSDIDAIINDAQSTIDDPNATVDQINAKAATLTDNLNTLAVNLLEQAKEQLKQSLRDLYQPGDYPSWYATVIIPALDQVDGVTWDFNKSVQENILYFQVTGQNLYNATKAALEALRGTDKRSIISSCAFTGFENGIKADMTWNFSALNNLINTLNTSVAAEPYRLDVEMSSLGKWDPVNKELIILDPYKAQKLTAGDYQFITAVKIDGEDAKQYRLPKATEEVLSVTVDAAVWAVDLSGIVIDANYSFTYVTSPMFTISKSEDVELVNEDPIKTQKIFHNGHFYILRGEHIYDLRGTRVK